MSHNKFTSQILAFSRSPTFGILAYFHPTSIRLHQPTMSVMINTKYGGGGEPITLKTLELKHVVFDLTRQPEQTIPKVIWPSADDPVRVTFKLHGSWQDTQQEATYLAIRVKWPLKPASATSETTYFQH